MLKFKFYEIQKEKKDYFKVEIKVDRDSKIKYGRSLKTTIAGDFQRDWKVMYNPNLETRLFVFSRELIIGETGNKVEYIFEEDGFDIMSYVSGLENVIEKFNNEWSNE